MVARAPAPMLEMLRVVTRRAFLAGADEHQQHRLGQARAAGRRDHRAVGHEGRVERNHRLLRWRARGERRIAGWSPFGKRRRQRRDFQAFGPAAVGKLGAMHAIDEHHAMGIERGQAFQRGFEFGRRARASHPPTAGGQRLLERDRRSVYFHSSMRRCGRPSAAKAPMAALRASATARPPGSFAAHRLEVSG